MVEMDRSAWLVAAAAAAAASLPRRLCADAVMLTLALMGGASLTQLVFCCSFSFKALCPWLFFYLF